MTDIHLRKKPLISRRRFEKGAIFATTKEALEAGLDCLIKAADLEEDRETSLEILDLLNIYREYTEKGTLNRSKSALATQVRSLENTSRALANRTKELTKLATNAAKPTDPPTLPRADATTQPDTGNSQVNYASIAAAGSEKWTTIARKTPPKPSPPAILATVKPKTTRQVIFRPINLPAKTSSFTMRNSFNKAFSTAYPKKPTVIAAASLSEKGNLVLTVTENYSTEFLHRNKAIVDSVMPTASILENKPWYKVAVHGIPTADLQEYSREDFSSLVKEEIKTFNTGLTAVGNPFWLTPEVKRATQRGGSIVIAFESEEEGRRAISKRLLLFGVSCKAEKLRASKTAYKPRNQTPPL